MSVSCVTLVKDINEASDSPKVDDSALIGPGLVALTDDFND